MPLLALLPGLVWLALAAYTAAPLVLAARRDRRTRQALGYLWRSRGRRGWPALTVAAPALLRPAADLEIIYRALPWACCACLAALAALT